MALTLDYNSITADYSCSSGDTTIVVDTSVAPIQVTLPLANTENGRVIIIKDSTGDAATNNITVEAQSPETIEGYATLLMQVNYGSVILASTGSGESAPGWALLSVI